VAKQSVREQIFDVGHHAAVKDKLRALLTSEMVPITEMQHDGICAAKTIDEEGKCFIAQIHSHKRHTYKLTFSLCSMLQCW
jgi:hypothetical protein